VNVGVITSIVLGVVMIVAGSSKLASRTWPMQAANLGVPTWLAAMVPWLELSLGAGLVVQLSSAAFGAATAVVVAAFTIKLVALLRRGQRPPCACFGGRVPRPISWLSVGRNAVLVALGIMTAVLS
jgi:hypothetical protein